MGSQPLLQRIRPETYLDLERESEFRSEYVNGEVYAMAGSSQTHARISFNVAKFLASQLDDGPCETYTVDFKVWVPTVGAFFYPDAFVVCGASRLKEGGNDAIENPKLIVEVLSDSTERYDRGAKFGMYRAIPELRQYVLISQKEPLVEVFTPEDRGFWARREYAGLDSIADFDAVGVRIPLAAIYRRIDFDLATPH